MLYYTRCSLNARRCSTVALTSSLRSVSKHREAHRIMFSITRTRRMTKSMRQTSGKFFFQITHVASGRAPVAHACKTHSESGTYPSKSWSSSMVFVTWFGLNRVPTRAHSSLLLGWFSIRIYACSTTTGVDNGLVYKRCTRDATALLH